MKCSSYRYTVMCAEKILPQYMYSVTGSELSITIQERDLEIIVDRSLKTLAECTASVKEANRMLGIIRKRIENKIKHILM